MSVAYVCQTTVAEMHLVVLAERINKYATSARQSARRAVEHALRAGELLLEAKGQVQHGEWLPWLTENCPDIAERTAQAYMQLARHRAQNVGAAADLEMMTLREALAEVNNKKIAVQDITEITTKNIISVEAPKSATVADLTPHPDHKIVIKAPGHRASKISASRPTKVMIEDVADAVSAYRNISSEFTAVAELEGFPANEARHYADLIAGSIKVLRKLRQKLLQIEPAEDTREAAA